MKWKNTISHIFPSEVGGSTASRVLGRLQTIDTMIVKMGFQRCTWTIASLVLRVLRKRRSWYFVSDLNA